MEEKIKQYAKEIEDSIRSEAQQYIESSVNEIIDDAIDRLRKLKKNSKRSTDQLLIRVKELETNLEREVGHRASLIEELMLSDERNKKNLNKLHTLQLKCNMLEKQVAKPTTAISLPASTNNTFEKPIAKPIIKDLPPVPSRPFTSWFYAIWLLNDKPDMSAKRLERELNVKYPTAWRIKRLVTSMESNLRVCLLNKSKETIEKGGEK